MTRSGHLRTALLEESSDTSSPLKTSAGLAPKAGDNWNLNCAQVSDTACRPYA
jgi:hypothetical protein